MNPPRPSQAKKRRKSSVNPELEAVNRTLAEIHQRRSSSPRRASKGRKLFTHQTADDDNVPPNAETSEHDVFKIPTAPAPKRQRLSHQPSGTSSANQSLDLENESEIIISRSDSPVGFNRSISEDEEISATSSAQSESSSKRTGEEIAPNEIEDDEAPKPPKRKGGRKKSSTHYRTNISSSNIIEDGKYSYIN